jgi:SAM-dependent methyltransferase
MTGTARYDGIADWYDTEFQPAPLESETWELLLGLLGDGAGSLLDVGCGTGSYTAALAERGWDVTGADISEDMLRRAGARGVRTVQADAASLPFEAA